MDCFIKAFVLVSLVLSVSATLSGEMQCNLTEQYPVKKNSKIVLCIPCRPCLPGLEPSIPCGTTVNDDAILGKCKPCEAGKFSPETSRKPCQDCQITQCLKHEIVQGNCTSIYDASRCMGICEDGHVMNTEKTKCIKAHVREKSTQAPKTDEEHQQKSQMSDWQIALAVIGVLVFITLAIIAVCWHMNRKNTRHEKVSEIRNCALHSRYANVDNDSISSAELLGGNITLVKQEDCLGNDGTTNRPHCPETSGGYATSAPTVLNNVSFNCNTSNIPSDHGKLEFGMKVTAPKPALLESPVPPGPPMSTARQTVPVVNPYVAANGNIAQPMVQLNNIIHNRAPDMTRFENWPKEAYDEICSEINHSVAPGRDWDALVGKLGFSVKDARKFEKTKDKTDALISCWMMERENTVAKFIDVLNNMRMTRLAHYIHDICERNRYF